MHVRQHEEVAAISDVHGNVAVSGKVDVQILAVQEGRDVLQIDAGDHVVFPLHIDRHQPGGGFEDDLGFGLHALDHARLHEDFGDGERPRAAPGLIGQRIYIEHAIVRLGRAGLGQDGPDEGQEPARLLHDAGAQPVVVPAHVFHFFSYGSALERRDAAGDDADRGARGVGVHNENRLGYKHNRLLFELVFSKKNLCWKRPPTGIR